MFSRICPTGRALLQRHAEYRPFALIQSKNRPQPLQYLRVLPSSIRYFSPPPIPNKFSYPSDERMVQEGLDYWNHDKWGWVIYRTTYKNDTAWARFKEIVNRKTRENFAQSDTPKLEESLEWTFVEDRATLDKASVSQLRERFTAWTTDREAILKDQPRVTKRYKISPGENLPDDFSCDPASRYMLFVYVDEEALQDVVSGDPDYWNEGYVNLVQAHWQLVGKEMVADEEPDYPDNIYPSIEGCTEYDVGVMRIAPSGLGAYLYDAVNGDGWYTFYVRPPDILY